MLPFFKEKNLYTYGNRKMTAPAKAQISLYKHDQGFLQKHLLKAILFQWPFKIL